MDKIIHFDINENVDSEDRISQIEELCKSNSKLSLEDVEVLLRNLSFLVRKKIADFEGVNIRDYLYSSKCDLAQSMIYYYLNKLGINVHSVNTNDVIPGVSGHSLILASFDTTEGEKLFLIDPTYLQFFSSEKCDDSKFVIINNTVCVSPDPGYFVVKSGKEEVILPLLKNGYIEFNEDVAEVYGDSFFKTKQGTLSSQINNNHASGSNYIKWFMYYKSNLSKTEKELDDMDLSIELKSKEKTR